jgi:hypothetical protein
MDYYSLDDILCDSTKIKTNLTVRINLPLISASSTLPFWLAFHLFTNACADIELPHYYATMKDDLKADPLEVNINQYNPYFFKFTRKIKNLL